MLETFYRITLKRTLNFFVESRVCWLRWLDGAEFDNVGVLGKSLIGIQVEMIKTKDFQHRELCSAKKAQDQEQLKCGE